MELNVLLSVHGQARAGVSASLRGGVARLRGAAGWGWWALCWCCTRMRPPSSKFAPMGSVAE
eukprot:scaffold37941_cov72-Phaeocystis_antarctica.AAC.2